MANYIKTGVVLDPVQTEKLDQLARMLGISRSLVIRIMISDALRRIEEETEVWDGEREEA